MLQNLVIKIQLTRKSIMLNPALKLYELLRVLVSVTLRMHYYLYIAVNLVETLA